MGNLKIFVLVIRLFLIHFFSWFVFYHICFGR